MIEGVVELIFAIIGLSFVIVGLFTLTVFLCSTCVFCKCIKSVNQDDGDFKWTIEKTDGKVTLNECELNTANTSDIENNIYESVTRV